MRKNISYALKYLTAALATVGIALALFAYKADGYSHWAKRLMYFTTQSNIWIGATALMLALLPFIKIGEKWEMRLYLLKYVFTVSITVTGLVFCGLLAPFADRDGYNAWSLSSVMTHVLVPILAIADYFIDPYPVLIKRRDVFYSALPPFLYLIFASGFILASVDFGRGDPYPYFFLNYHSPAGFFGFSPDTPPFVLGSFYWIIVFLIMVLTLGFIFARLKTSIQNKSKKLHINNYKPKA